MFVSVSGIAYENFRKEPGMLAGLTHYYWGDGKEIDEGMLYGLVCFWEKS